VGGFILEHPPLAEATALRWDVKTCQELFRPLQLESAEDTGIPGATDKGSGSNTAQWGGTRLETLCATYLDTIALMDVQFASGLLGSYFLSHRNTSNATT